MLMTSEWLQELPGLCGETEEEWEEDLVEDREDE
jgi:hypothetical protein